MKRGTFALLATLAAAAACAAPRRDATDPMAEAVKRAYPEGGATDATKMSSPAEYAERPISAEAGATYFLETGSGDPYNAGLAYPVFLAMMELFPDELGADWAALADKFGFIARSDRDPKQTPPIGFHLTIDPNTNVPWVVGNCQLCHAERLVLPPGPGEKAPREVVVAGLGNKRVRIHAYANALLRIGKDPRLDPKRVEEAATRRARAWGVPWPEASRRAIVDATLAGWKKLSDQRLERAARLDGGMPGRVATIESFAIALGDARGRPVTTPKTIGWAKVPDVRGFPFRDTFSWDGSGYGSPQALVLDADFVFGARPEWYVAHPHIATSTYLYLRSFSRKLPFPRPIDAPLAARGKTLFDAKCARCHGTYVEQDGDMRVAYRERVVPLAMIGTDPARAEAVTEDFVDAANALPITRGHARVRSTGGYVPPVLLDVWARGVYGHVGQWPSLEVLATPPAHRPRAFVMDPNAPYDLDRVGVHYEATTRSTRAGEIAFDATKPGFSVDGHAFLSDLPTGDRRAVIEYLKTLTSR